MSTGRKLFRVKPASVVCGLVIAALYAPILLVMINSFNADERLIEWGGFTLSWYSDAIGDARVRDAFVTSIVIAVASTGLSLVIGTTAALWAHRAGHTGRSLLDVATLMRIVLPEVVLAVGLFLVLTEAGFPLGMVAIIAGHVVFCSAYVTLLAQARLTTMVPDAEDAAADLGASPLRVFWRVTLPFLTPALLVSALLVMTFSFDDVVTSQFLGGSNAETLPVLLLGKIRLAVTPEINAIGTLVMLLTVSVLLLAAVAARRFTSK